MHCDLIIRDATILDGTGAPRIRGDVGVTGDRIAGMGDLGAATADRDVLAHGRAVAPGFIETAMTAALSAEQKARLTERIPLARLGQPEDVAAAVLYLASDEAAWVTGATLHVNGGMAMA